MTTAVKWIDESAEDEHVLADRARCGSGAAFAVLVTRHRDAIYVIATNMCATRRDAEEAIQHTFLTAWRNLGRLAAGARFATWLYAIAMRMVLACREGDRRPPTSSLDGLLPVFDVDGRLRESNDRRGDAGGAFSGRVEVTGVLREALECLDDPTRAAFVLRSLLDLSAEESAVVLRTTPRSIRRDLHRAHLLLRGFIDRL